VVLARPAPAKPAWDECAPPLASIAADFAIHNFLQQGLTNENLFDFP
jgi:hypothetical protein